MKARRLNWILIIIAVTFLLLYGGSIRDGDPDLDGAAQEAVE